MKAHTGESGVQPLLEMQVTQFHLNLRQAQRCARGESLIHLTQLQALFDIAFKAQFAAGGGDVQ
ncbi:hypothetical protein D3C79_924150 [compost metagenome]